MKGLALKVTNNDDKTESECSPAGALFTAEQAAPAGSVTAANAVIFTSQNTVCEV